MDAFGDLSQAIRKNQGAVDTSSHVFEVVDDIADSFQTRFDEAKAREEKLSSSEETNQQNRSTKKSEEPENKDVEHPEEAKKAEIKEKNTDSEEVEDAIPTIISDEQQIPFATEEIPLPSADEQAITQKIEEIQEEAPITDKPIIPPEESPKAAEKVTIAESRLEETATEVQNAMEPVEADTVIEEKIHQENEIIRPLEQESLPETTEVEPADQIDASTNPLEKPTTPLPESTDETPFVESTVDPAQQLPPTAQKEIEQVAVEEIPQERQVIAPKPIQQERQSLPLSEQKELSDQNREQAANTLKLEANPPKEELSLRQEAEQPTDSHDIVPESEQKQLITIDSQEGERIAKTLEQIIKQTQLLAPSPKNLSQKVVEGIQSSGNQTLQKMAAQEVQGTTADPISSPFQGREPQLQSSEAAQKSQRPAMQSRLEQLKEQVVEQVRVKLNMSKDGQQGELRIRLKPGFLGDIKITMSFEENQAKAHFAVENQSVRDLLQKSSGELQKSLAEQGIDVDQVVVEVDEEQSSGRGEKNAFEQQEDQEAAREWIASFVRPEKIGDEVEDSGEQLIEEQGVNIIA